VFKAATSLMFIRTFDSHSAESYDLVLNQKCSLFKKSTISVKITVCTYTASIHAIIFFKFLLRANTCNFFFFADLTGGTKIHLSAGTYTYKYASTALRFLSTNVYPFPNLFCSYPIKLFN